MPTSNVVNLRKFLCSFIIKFYLSKNIEENKKELPYLLKYYKENFKLSDLSIDITKRYNETNNLPKELEKILKEVILND